MHYCQLQCSPIYETIGTLLRVSRGMCMWQRSSKVAGVCSVTAHKNGANSIVGIIVFISYHYGRV